MIISRIWSAYQKWREERAVKSALKNLFVSRGESESALNILIEHALGRRYPSDKIRMLASQMRAGFTDTKDKDK